MRREDMFLYRSDGTTNPLFLTSPCLAMSVKVDWHIMHNPKHNLSHKTLCRCPPLLNLLSQSDSMLTVENWNVPDVCVGVQSLLRHNAQSYLVCCRTTLSATLTLPLRWPRNTWIFQKCLMLKVQYICTQTNSFSQNAAIDQCFHYCNGIQLSLIRNEISNK